MYLVYDSHNKINKWPTIIIAVKLARLCPGPLMRELTVLSLRRHKWIVSVL